MFGSAERRASCGKRVKEIWRYEEKKRQAGHSSGLPRSEGNVHAVGTNAKGAISESLVAAVVAVVTGKIGIRGYRGDVDLGQHATRVSCCQISTLRRRRGGMQPQISAAWKSF
jgi:hypothetical protein